MKPIEILVNEHNVIERVLDCLEKMCLEIDGGEPLDEALARDAIAFFRNFADKNHHMKEEDELFPMLEAHGFPRDGGPIGVMLYEHVEGRGHVGDMEAAVTAGDPERFVGAARTFIELLRAHIMKENEVLFPMADQALDAAAQEKLLGSFRSIEDEAKFLAIADALGRRYDVGA